MSSRIALIVAIEDYRRLPPLRTPYQDAHLIGRTLEAVGFDVSVLGCDAPSRDISAVRDAIADFRSRIEALAADAAQGGCAVFMFAGHGVSHAGETFLLGEDADLASAGRLRTYGLPLSEVLEELDVGEDIAKVVLIDACQSRLKAGSVEPMRLPRRLPHDMLVSFSSHFGEASLDGQDHSPYALALAEHLVAPDRSLKDSLAHVTAAVRRMTHGAQSCMHLDTLGLPLNLGPIPLPEAREPKVDQLSAEAIERAFACKLRDEAGRWAWYVLTLHPDRTVAFRDALARAGSIDLSDYGVVLAREYDEVLSEGLCAHVERRHGPELGRRLRQVRLRQAAFASSGG